MTHQQFYSCDSNHLWTLTWNKQIYVMIKKNMLIMYHSFHIVIYLMGFIYR